MFDLIVSNAVLPDGRLGDIGIRAGRIEAIAPLAGQEAGERLDAGGHLVTPPFVDCHFHLDYALTAPLAPPNISGTLFEGIRNWRAIKDSLTEEGIYTRARRLCEIAISQGTLAIRSHVDIGDPQLRGLRALLRLREELRPWLAIQLVAFPQDGYFRRAGNDRQVARAVEMGVDVIGGIPHYERTTAQGDASIRALFRLAAERGLRVDMHCDENDDPQSRHVETMTACAVEYGLAGRVSASHLTSMHSMPGPAADKIMSLLAETGVAAIANPLVNMTLQGRFDTYPRRRGLMPVPEMIRAGVAVGFGHDCVMDPWYALGAHDMLDVASLAVHGVPMTGVDDIRSCWRAITDIGAQVLGLSDYGLAVGKPADFVIVQAKSIVDAVRLRAPRLHVFRRGICIAATPPAVRMLHLDRDSVLDPAGMWRDDALSRP
ncbi:MAG: cytosine deaminase [Gluconacetobacter sp.]